MILCSGELIKEYREKGWWGDTTIYDLFLENARKNPGDVAIVDPPNRRDLTAGEPLKLTYTELKDKVDRLTLGLARAGIQKDDIVIVQLPNIVELACIYLALSRLGAAVSPLPIQYRTHELRHTIDITRPRAVITTVDFRGFDHVGMALEISKEFPCVQNVIGIGEGLPPGVLSLNDILSTPAGEKELESIVEKNLPTADDVLTVCWTSGTESAPKGVPRSHNHWIAIAYFTIDAFEMKEGCCILNPFPMTNMASIGSMFIPWLQTGGKLVLHHPMDLPVFLNQIQEEKVNYTVAPPALLTMLLQKKELLDSIDKSSLQSIASGSVPLSPWMVSQYQYNYGIYIVNLFGSNEGISFVSDPKDMPDPEDRAKFFPRWGVPGYQWTSRMAASMLSKIVDPATKEEITSPGIPGEMCVKSPAVFCGYYNRPDLTEQAFDQDGYFYTGDLFSIEGTGDNLNRYLFHGRSKELIIRGGMNISPEELELLIAEHPKVTEVAVIGYPDERLGEKVCAVIASSNGEKVDLDEIIEFLKGKDIAVYKLPEKIRQFEYLPRNPVGKIMKGAIKEMIKNES